MRLGTVIQVIGWLLAVVAVAMLLPAFAAVVLDETDLALAFAVCALLILFAGLGLVGASRGSGSIQSLNEGLLLVVVAWLIVPMVAGFPLAVVDGIPTLLDAWFEAVSGLTTTGATLITDYESVSPVIFLWRSLLQWLGGLFVILTAMHILVVIGATSLPIKRVKLPTPEFLGGGEDINSRILHSLVGVLIIYGTLTFACFLLLWLTGGDIRGWEALCLSLSAVSTGGFVTRSGGIDAYGAPMLEGILVIMMILASMNFVMHWHGLRGRFKEYWRVPELQYLVMIMAFTFVGVWLTTLIMTGEAHFWNSLFNGISLLSTSGFYVTDGSAISDIPPVLVLIPLMIGGAAISTTGGFKVVRFILLIKHSEREMKRLGHPHGVFPIRFGDYRVSEVTMDAVLALFLGFMSLMAVLAFVVGWAGYDFEVSLMAASAAVMNAGPFLEAQTGGAVTYAEFPAYVRVALGLGMIIGRVEILAFVVIFNLNFWRR